jgi:hypothetical protein
MRFLMLGALIATGVASPAAAQRDCRYEATRTATLRADAGESLDLIARSGSLTVRGREGLSEVRVVGHACASSEELLEQLVLETGRSGSTIRVEVADVDDDGWNPLENRYHTMPLEVEIPAGMAARIEDGSGELLIEGVGRLTLEDGSGEIELRDIDGDVEIDDGSGDIRVEGVEGTIRVNDGSGGIDISGVAGTVDVVDDGSGSIDVRDIAGDFIVRDDGSGGIHYSNVGGRVDIPRRRR